MNNEIKNDEKQTNPENGSQKDVNQEYDQLKKEAEEDTKTKKPGSQSNHSSQHNNGRGGGK